MFIASIFPAYRIIHLENVIYAVGNLLTYCR